MSRTQKDYEEAYRRVLGLCEAPIVDYAIAEKRVDILWRLRHYVPDRLKEVASLHIFWPEAFPLRGEDLDYVRRGAFYAWEEHCKDFQVEGSTQVWPSHLKKPKAARAAGG